MKSVESDGNGGIKVTVTKNGTDTSYNIKQGEQGAAGKDADVWKIGEDGYWYKNDTKTEYKALGTKGEPRAKRAKPVLLVLLAKTASTTFLILRLAHSGYMVTVTRLHTTLRLSIQQLTRMSSLQFGTTIT